VKRPHTILCQRSHNRHVLGGVGAEVRLIHIRVLRSASDGAHVGLERSHLLPPPPASL
jgi:hypothetical protein